MEGSAGVLVRRHPGLNTARARRGILACYQPDGCAFAAATTVRLDACNSASVHVEGGPLADSPDFGWVPEEGSPRRAYEMSAKKSPVRRSSWPKWLARLRQAEKLPQRGSFQGWRSSAGFVGRLRAEGQQEAQAPGPLDLKCRLRPLLL